MLWATIPVSAMERRWIAQSTGNSGNWSNPGNWSPAGMPQNGDDLIFDDPSRRRGMHNDLVGLQIRRLSFCGEGDTTGPAWSLDGNELTLLERAGYLQTNTCGDSSFLFTCPLKLGGTTTMAISEAGGTLIVRGNIDLNGNDLRLSSGDQIIVSGQITGMGNVIATVDSYAEVNSKIMFDGPTGNTFSGKLTVQQIHNLTGEVIFDKEFGNVVNDALLIDGDFSLPAVCKLARAHQIGDNAEVCVTGGSQFLLDGHTETIGSLCLSNITGQTEATLVDSGGSTLSVSADIIVHNVNSNFSVPVPRIQGKLGFPLGNHTIHVEGVFPGSRGFDIYAQIIGDGGFTKAGRMILVLEGDNTFNGDVVVLDGTVIVSHENALGTVAGSTKLNNGTGLNLNGVAIAGETLITSGSNASALVASGSTPCGWGGPVILNQGLNFNAGTITFSGPISGAGNLTLSGNDTVEISGTTANTFTGEFVIRNRLCLLNKSSGVAAFGGPLIVGPNSAAGNEVRWLRDYQCVGADVRLDQSALINLNNHREDFGPVAFNGGGTISTGTGELGIYGLVTVNSPGNNSALISGRLGLPPGLHEFRVNDGAAFPDLLIDATVLGAGHLRKTGAGQMWLASANTYQGVTFVAEGALSVLHPNGLGAASAGTTVNEGATLEFNFAGGTVPEQLALRGSGSAGGGALGVFGDVTLRPSLPSIYAAIDLTTNTTIGVAPSSQLLVDGTISGVGHLTKAGLGTLRFGGTDHNTYSGETFIDEGTFIMGKPTGTSAVPGPLSIGTSAGLSATAANVASYQVIGNIFVNRGGLLYLNGQVENVDHLWLSEGGDVQTSPPGVLFLKSGGTIQVVPGAVGDPATIAGILDMDAGSHVINVGSSSAISGPNLEINAQITSTLGALTLQKDGPGTLRLTANNTYGGTTIVNQGVLRVDGGQQQGTLQVNAAGTLQGVGVVGNIRFSGGGVVSPGASPGVLGCNSFNINAAGGGILEIELNGPSPGSGYDRLDVGGSGQINLSGITLRAKANFVAATNQQFVIISDLGDSAVQGTFNGLPENGTLAVGDQIFRINYSGGDGNDVVLTKIADIGHPRLTIERVAPAFVRLLWSTSAPPFRLQSNTNLTGTNWAVVSPPPALVGTNNVVTNAAATAQRFFRLISP